MLTPLEKKRLEVEYHRVYAQQQDYEYRLMENENSANQLREAIEIQKTKAQELKDKLEQE